LTWGVSPAMWMKFDSYLVTVRNEIKFILSRKESSFYSSSTVDRSEWFFRKSPWSNWLDTGTSSTKKSSLDGLTRAVQGLMLSAGTITSSWLTVSTMYNSPLTMRTTAPTQPFRPSWPATSASIRSPSLYWRYMPSAFWAHLRSFKGTQVSWVSFAIRAFKTPESFVMSRITPSCQTPPALYSTL